MGLFDRAVVRLLPAVPRPIVQRLSSPYIAGPSFGDARRVVAELNAEGQRATVAVLGEEVTSVDEANAFAGAYREALELFARDGLDANISVKPTALGLKLDRGLCRELAESLVREAAGRGTLVRLDMEDASCTDATLGLYRSLREAGHDNVGVVLQAYLRRTLADIAELAELTPNVRLCKGIYVEPPAIAFHDANVIRRSFVSALEALLGAGCFVGVATHDEPLIRESLALLEGAQPGAYELQMLLGVRKQRAAELVAAGHGLRVYVPFGEQWYEYSLRRLQENPRVAG
ncbi:MAG TPA: proline dehydrogenase family protein, partial [Gaiellaceae bacterium]